MVGCHEREPMQRRKVRFKLATIMIVIAVLAIALAIIEPLWNRPIRIDPFDPIEMIGPVPARPGRVVPRTIQEPTQQAEDSVGRLPHLRPSPLADDRSVQ